MNQTPAVRYVVDASIAVKWFLPDELYADKAVGLLTTAGAGSVELLAPDHLYYEIANVFRTAARQRRVSEEQARDSLLDLLAVPILTSGGHRLLLRGYDLARQYDCAAYDGLYLALADAAGCPLIHADRRLRNTLDGRFDLELWIEDFEVPGI